MPGKLHIGGQVRMPGWEVLDANPGPCVDHVANASDLGAFEDNSFEQIHASHVVEHCDYQNQLVGTLEEWCRVLKPAARAPLNSRTLPISLNMIAIKA
jgi:predicted SAM-dependent methyltransferase